MGRESGNDDIHQLRFRESDLNETNTRYDNIVAGGSDQERFIQWTVYATIALLAATVALLVLMAILRKTNVRRQSFNLFLVFLIVPDLVFSIFCGVNCALNAAHGDYISASWCRFQAFYCVWGIGCNAWLNAAIARHLHRMLQCGARMERYFPPTWQRVVCESLGVYVWMAFVASWVFIPFLPHDIALSAGLACLPHEYDTASTVFLWTVFMPAFALLPTAYALYVAWDIMVYNKLLPPRGKKRDLAVYFARIVAVFLLMWVPSIFLMFIAVCLWDFCSSLRIHLDIPGPEPSAIFPLLGRTISLGFVTRHRVVTRVHGWLSLVDVGVTLKALYRPL